MHITFAPRNILQIDDARIIHRNFAGAGNMYNREGDRNFSVVIETRELADELIERGWNVKIKESSDPGEVPLMYLPVKVKYFDDRGPSAYLKSGNAVTKLDENTIHRLDKVSVLSADLDIRPYDWGPINGKYGRSAYLDSIDVTQKVDRFAERYANEDVEY